MHRLRNASSRLSDQQCLSYRAPWTSPADVPPGSLDLVFSQAVLQYVDRLDRAYRAMFTWLKPGGYASHATGLGANDISPYWNGHWSCSERQWKVVRGRREYLLNREPISTHMRLGRQAGFDILHVDTEQNHNGLPRTKLAHPFRDLPEEDLLTSGAMIVLRKPQTAA